MTYSVTKHVHFCYGHRLLDYDGKCRHLHGHNGVLEVTVEKTELDRLGMVADFSAIQAMVQSLADGELDHRMILSEKDPLLPLLKGQGQPCLALKGNPTAEAIARHIFERLRDKGIPVSMVRLWETSTSNASYRE